MDLSEGPIRTIILGSRGSPLALCQTGYVLDRLAALSPEHPFEIRVIRTTGDREQLTPLHDFPTPGVFVHEISSQLQAGDIDVAVHSLKDVPPGDSPGLILAAFPQRVDPRDVIVSRDALPFAALPIGSRVGTSSTRRQALLRARRPDLQYCSDLRGNVDTRIRKLHAGEYDAIVLAAAGLIRLGRSDAISDFLPTDVCLPDAGQGTLGVQIRSDDREIGQLVSQIDDPGIRATALAERAVLAAFGGGCKVPVAAYARVDAGTLHLQGLVASIDGRAVVRAELSGSVDAPAELGHQLWALLVRGGADRLLRDGTHD